VAICGNRLQVKMADADHAILSLVESRLFGSGITRQLLEHFTQCRATFATRTADDRATLDAAVKTLERQQQNLVEAIANRGDASRALQIKLAAVEQELHDVEARRRHESTLVSLDPEEVGARFAALADDWGGLLKRHPLQARSIVKKLISGKFKFEPHIEPERRFYRITGNLSTAHLVGAVVPGLLQRHRQIGLARSWPQRDSNPSLGAPPAGGRPVD
jgi:hypothetical protein